MRFTVVHTSYVLTKTLKPTDSDSLEVLSFHSDLIISVGVSLFPKLN